MLLKDLDFNLPTELIATQPQRPSRVLQTFQDPKEISLQDLKDLFKKGDVLVINDTQVMKRRIFSEKEEILFLSSQDQKTWEVLFPAKAYKLGDEISLPLGKKIKLIEKGRPQKVLASEVLDDTYFSQVAEIPLPPYIQQARGQRKPFSEDSQWYQTAWAQTPGSLAAPTASLHFSLQDLADLKAKGVLVLPITLHVGLGTFLPVKVENLKDHVMHSEWASLPESTWAEINNAKKQGRKIWAMGTTVLRTLESAALGRFENLRGETNLLIAPPFDFKVVDYLLTNFHQPQSTLLALVFAFSGMEKVKKAYQYAIEKKMRWLSYGDLSVWQKQELK